MIRPRWNRRASTSLTNLGGSLRQISSRHPFRSSSPRLDRNETKASSEGTGEDDRGLPRKAQLAMLRRELTRMDRLETKHGSRSESRNASGSELRHTSRLESRGGASNWEPRQPQVKEKGSSGLIQRVYERRKMGPREHTMQKEDTAPAEGKGKQQKMMDDEDGVGRRKALSGDGDQAFWPLLKRKPQRKQHIAGSKFNPIGYQTGIPNHPKPRSSSPVRNESRHMLVVEGLSPSLNPGDFYRIAPTDLSDWSSVIKKVQQKRDPVTLEALGQYLITFSTSEAAVAYRDRLHRLHKLSKLKLNSPTGLWESTVPLNLRANLENGSDSSSPNAAESESGPDLSDEVASIAASSTTTSASDGGGGELLNLVNSFTIAPASFPRIQTEQKRVTISHAWAQNLRQIVEPLGYGDRPSVLLLDVYPPTLTHWELFKFIRLDGHTRGLRWQVAMPHHLKPLPTPTPDDEGAIGDVAVSIPGRIEGEASEATKPSFLFKDHDTWEKVKARFVLACANESEAKRFQRSWNNRTLTTSRPRVARYIVHASIINW